MAAGQAADDPDIADVGRRNTLKPRNCLSTEYRNVEGVFETRRMRTYSSGTRLRISKPHFDEVQLLLWEKPRTASPPSADRNNSATRTARLFKPLQPELPASSHFRH